MQPPAQPPNPLSPAPIDPLDYWNSSNAVPPIHLDRSWWEIWKHLVLYPTPEDYRELLQEPNRGMQRSLTWVAVVWFVALILQVVSSLFVNMNNFQFNTLGNSTTTSTADPSMGASLGSVICFSIICAPFLLVIGLVFYLIFSCGVPHVVALVLGGKGTFENIVFLFSGIYALTSLVGAVVGLVGLGLVSLLFGGNFSMFLFGYLVVSALGTLTTVYALILEVVALKAVHGFGWLKSIISALGLYLVIFGFVFLCLGLVFLPLLSQ